MKTNKNMDYTSKQKELKGKARMGRIYSLGGGNYSIEKHGLIGEDGEALKSLFDEDDKPLMLDKLTNMQKKSHTKNGLEQADFLKKLTVEHCHS